MDGCCNFFNPGTAARPGEDDQFVFINSWNEWAEGAALEPSRTHGRSYLVATKTALQRGAESDTELRRLEVRIDGRLERLGNSLDDLRSPLSWLEDSVRAHDAGR